MNADPSQHTSGSEVPRRFYGKYRGLVLSNVDPMQRGRLMVQVPDVTGLVPGTWAEACIPCGGMQYGLFGIPLIGAGVWIEFEQGDLNYPIWTGTFYSNAGEVPALSRAIPPGVPGMAMVTPLQNAVIVNDTPGPTGGIMLKGGLATITINDTGITIQNGKGASISMVGPQVIINAGALTVI